MAIPTDTFNFGFGRPTLETDYDQDTVTLVIPYRSAGSMVYVRWKLPLGLFMDIRHDSFMNGEPRLSERELFQYMHDWSAKKLAIAAMKEAEKEEDRHAANAPFL